MNRKFSVQVDPETQKVTLLTEDGRVVVFETLEDARAFARRLLRAADAADRIDAERREAQQKD